MIDVSFFFFFKQKTAYEMRISDWSSDVCSSDLIDAARSDVGRDADLGAAVAQRLQRLVAFVLAMLARQGNRGETALDEARVKAADIVPRRAEQHRGFGIVKTEIGRASCRESGCQYV